MKKILVLVILLLFPITVLASSEVSSKSAIVVNREDNNILYELNIHDELPIASLTKIATTIVTLENIKDLNQEVTVTNKDISNLLGYATIDLKENDKVTYEELIYSTIMNSAADSANVLANNVFDNYDEFINKMNELAKKLKMENTKFSNPIGMDEDNYSSSYDLYLLLDYALDNKMFYKIFTTNKYNIKSLNKTITNNINDTVKKNNIKSNNITFSGYKGGFTTNSGVSLAAITKLDNNELIIIDIGSDNSIDNNEHLIDSLNILSEIKDNYSNRVILEKDKLVDNIIFKNNKKTVDYEIKSTKTHKKYMKNDIDLNYLKIFYEGKTEIDNNINYKEEIGKIKIYYQDELLDSESVLFNKKNIIKTKRDYKNIIIFIVICLVGLVIFRRKK